MNRPTILHASVLLFLLVSGCSDPACPRNLVQDGMICRHCPDGAYVKNNLCMFPDAGEAGLPDANSDPEDAAGDTDEGDGGPEPSNPSDGSGLDAGGNNLNPGADGAADAAGPGPTDGQVASACDGAAGCCEGGAGCPCAADQKQCRSSCIPEANCCEDQDCGAGLRCILGSCKYWCETQVRPSSVLPADYQCLDFERGLPPSTAWMPEMVDGGVVTTWMDRALSVPSSLRTRQGGLTWSTRGAGTISSLTFSVALNPAQHPTILAEPPVASLVCITYGDLGSGGSSFEQCVNYTFKGTIDGVANYTGLYLRTFAIAGAAIELIEPLYDSAAPSEPLNVSPNIWNTLSVNAGTGGMTLVVNGKTSAVRLAAPRDTVASVSIGAGDWNISYDNVVVAIGR